MVLVHHSGCHQVRSPAPLVTFVRVLPARLQRPLGGIDLMGGGSKLGGGRVGVLPHRIIQIRGVIAVLRIAR